MKSTRDVSYIAEIGTNVTQAAEGEDTEGYAASSQVWNKTELLEHVIFHLPAKSIVMVSGVNKMAYNCVANSSIAQAKLFMRPISHEEDLWVYCEFYLPSTRLFQIERQLVAQSFEPSMDAYYKIRTGKSDATARLVSVVASCPLLELEDAQETTALGRLKRKGWQDNERVYLTGLPAENTRYANMILTDPPANSVDVELAFKHNLWPVLKIRAERRIKIEQLTIGMALRSACSKPGNTFLHGPPMPSNNYNRSHACLPRSTVNDVILQTVKEHGGSFSLDLTNKRFVFQNTRIVVPSAEEIMEMDAKRDE